MARAYPRVGGQLAARISHDTILGAVGHPALRNTATQIPSLERPADGPPARGVSTDAATASSGQTPSSNASFDRCGNERRERSAGAPPRRARQDKKTTAPRRTPRREAVGSNGREVQKGGNRDASGRRLIGLAIPEMPGPVDGTAERGDPEFGSAVHGPSKSDAGPAPFADSPRPLNRRSPCRYSQHCSQPSSPSWVPRRSEPGSSEAGRPPTSRSAGPPERPWWDR